MEFSIRSTTGLGTVSWELVGADAGLAFQAVSFTPNKPSGVFPVQASAFMVPAC